MSDKPRSLYMQAIERLAANGTLIDPATRDLYEKTTGQALPCPMPQPVTVAASDSKMLAPVVTALVKVSHYRVTRSPKTRASRFARIDNAVLQDSRLSFRARGLLAQVLSYVPSFSWSAERLAAVSPDGKDAIRGALRELVKFGYAELRRDRGKSGNVVNAWYFYESPRAINPDSVTGSGFTGAGKPDSGEPALGGVALLETTVGETTIRNTTTHAQSVRGVKSGAFTLPEAIALADDDSPVSRQAWDQWAHYLAEKGMLNRLTLTAQREAFIQLGDNAPAAVANTIVACLRQLCLPKNDHRPAPPVKALPDNLKPF